MSVWVCVSECESVGVRGCVSVLRMGAPCIRPRPSPQSHRGLVWGLGFSVQGLGLRVEGRGCKDYGFRVEGSWWRAEGSWWRVEG